MTIEVHDDEDSLLIEFPDYAVERLHEPESAERIAATLLAWAKKARAARGLPDADNQAVWLREKLRPWANLVSARFGAPVYLVGSALREKWPRDIDVRVILPADDYVARYGSWLDRKDVSLVRWPIGARRWAADCGKQNRYVAKVHGLNVDFQIHHEQEAEKEEANPRVRLDEVEAGDEGAAEQAFLRRLVDIAWNEATESETTPSTEWADRLIARARAGEGGRP